jgi:predicted nucleic acid-binding Zn ribbon protein
VPEYVYECLDCASSHDLENIKDDVYEEQVLYVTKHSMQPTESEMAEACVCPRCSGTKHKRVFHGYTITGYVRGNGYLDKVGAHRDMNIYKLTQEDPYAQYRQSGEVDHIKENLQKQGKFDPKTKYFT